MFKSLKYFLSFLFIAALMLACKPVRKSYVPYRKKNKCGCPTYGLQQKFRPDHGLSAQASNAKILF
jgi:hypothetical protein